MVVVLIIGGLAIAGAVVARATWNQVVDERNSVRDHQHALETLRHLSDRSEVPRPVPVGHTAPRTPRARKAPAPAPVKTAPAKTASAKTASAKTAPVRTAPARTASARSERPQRSRPHVDGPARVHHDGAVDLVFTDDAVGARCDGPDLLSSTAAFSPATATAGRLGDHQRPRLIGRIPPRSLVRVSVVAAAVAVLVVVVVDTSAPAARPRAIAHHRTVPRTATDHHVAAPALYEPTNWTPVSATYDVRASPYTVDLTSTTAPCWVLATDPITKAVVWTGTLVVGERMPLTATGGLLVRLGASHAVTVSLNGEPVVMPGGYQSPFDMTFATA